MKAFHSTLIALSTTLAACASTRAEPVVGDSDHPQTETVALSSVATSLAPGFDPFGAEHAEADGRPGEDPSTHSHDAPAPQGEATQYVCPMHPEVVSDKPAKCPKCGMDLVPKKAKGAERAAP